MRQLAAPHHPTHPAGPPSRIFQNPVLLNVWDLCGSWWGHFGHGVSVSTTDWGSPYGPKSCRVALRQNLATAASRPSAAAVWWARWVYFDWLDWLWLVQEEVVGHKRA